MGVRRLMAPLLCVCVMLGFGACNVSACATVGFEFLRQFKIESPGTVRDMAVQHATGHVLVADSNGVEVYESNGVHVTTWTGFGAAGAIRVAVDNSTGVVYVAALEGSTNSIAVLDADGNRQSTITGTPEGSFHSIRGLSVDQATGDLYVTDYVESGLSTSVVDVFDSSGQYRAQITDTGSKAVFFGPTFAAAVDDIDGDVFIPSPRSRAVYVYHKIGNAYAYEYLATWNGSPTKAGSFAVVGESILTVASGPSGYILVADDAHGVVDVFATNEVSKEEYEESPIERILCPPAVEGCGPFPVGVAYELGINAVAVDSVTGEEYILDHPEREKTEVDIFSAPTPLPSLRVRAPSEVSSSCATLVGIAEPGGSDEHNIVFEYGATTAYGSMVSASPSEAPVAGGPVRVNARVCGLEAGAEYHYRLKATNITGVGSSADQRAITTPLVEGLSATQVGPNSATLNATIEPGVVPTTYHFKYWPEGSQESDASVIPVPDASFPVLRRPNVLSQPLTGLHSGVTYHFRIITNSSAGSVGGPEEVFTTPLTPLPLVATGGASAVGVSQATLSGVVDPLGEPTSYRFEYGTSVGYGSNWPTVDVEVGTSTGEQTLSVNLENLLPNTTYHFRLVASDQAGTAYGADQSFETGSYPKSLIQETPILGTFVLPSEQPVHSISVSKGKPKKKHKKIRLRKPVKKTAKRARKIKKRH